MTGVKPPPGVDTTVSSPARMYDFWLGGHDNFAADRAAASAVSRAVPEIPVMAVENRSFLRRAVRQLAHDAGLVQFLDIGTGLPTCGNVHEIAQSVTPDAKVVYVDNDPMVLAHAHALETVGKVGGMTADKTSGKTVMVDADLRDPKGILGHPATRELIDFSQPVAVLLVAVLHLIGDDDDPLGIVRTLRDAIVPGSYLVLTHVTGDFRRDAATGYYQRVNSGATLRGREEISRFFEGFDILDPGLVQVPDWRPDESLPPEASSAWLVGGVGRKSG